MPTPTKVNRRSARKADSLAGTYVVGAEDLEDQAAVVDADLQHGDGAGRRAAGGGAPLHVEAGDVAAAVHAVGLGHPPVHHVAGVRKRRVDVVLVERHHRGSVLVVALDLGRHDLSRALWVLCSRALLKMGRKWARWGSGYIGRRRAGNKIEGCCGFPDRARS